MEENENGENIRFYQWIDDQGTYSDESFLGRVAFLKQRFIRKEEAQDDRPYTQGKNFIRTNLDLQTVTKCILEELEDIPDLTTVKVKWFVPVGRRFYDVLLRIIGHVKHILNLWDTCMKMIIIQKINI